MPPDPISFARALDVGIKAYRKALEEQISRTANLFEMFRDHEAIQRRIAQKIALRESLPEKYRRQPGIGLRRRSDGTLTIQPREDEYDW